MKFTNLTAKPKMDWTAASGTCLQGYIDANYADLCEKLGAHSNGDEYKVDAEWVLRFSDGTIATIYNYKDGKNYCGEDGLDVDDITEWHVGGRSKRAVELVQKLLA